MKSRYLGRVAFDHAVEAQEQIKREILEAGGQGVLLGFETEPVITLGVRGEPERDIVFGGFEIRRVDRGGQATLHNPGQLVIFPVVPIRGVGVRNWIEGLAAVTITTLREWGVEAAWDESRPGLYTARGKIMSLGVRLTHGVSTHGLAINVCNNLGDFGAIRVCGASCAAMDRMGEEIKPERVFPVWVQNFQRQFALTS